MLKEGRVCESYESLIYVPCKLAWRAWHHDTYLPLSNSIESILRDSLHPWYVNLSHSLARLISLIPTSP